MNLPNILTMSRVVFAGLLYWFGQQPTAWAAWLALIVFALGALSDFLDGYLARRYGVTSEFGKLMDPVTDKVLVLTAFGLLVRQGFVAEWIFWTILIREVLVTATRLILIRRGLVLAAERAGKIKTVLQMAAIFFVLIANTIMSSVSDPSSWLFQQATLTLFFVVSQGLVLSALVMTIYSGVQFFRVNRGHLLGGRG